MTDTGSIRYEADADGIVTLTMDQPGPVNVMNAEFRAALAATVARLEAERDAIRGVVVTSAKKSFFAGADLNELVAVTRAQLEPFADAVAALKADLRRLERLGRPVVAAVGGSALGGGLEIALACHHRVVLDRGDVRLGFPEVTLGVLPGAGGVVRTVRMLGVQAALPLLTEGKQLRPAAALDAGWADELAADADELMAKARAWVLAHPDAAQPWDVAPGPGVKDLKPLDPRSYGLLAAAPAMLRKKTHGAFPAPESILAAAVEGALVDFDTALEVEGRYFVELATGQVAKNMIGAFWFQLNEIKAGASRPADVPKYRTERVAVLGAGMMGAGIAQVTAVAGIDVVLKDVTAQAAQKGKDGVAAQLDGLVEKGRMKSEARDAALGRIRVAGDYADLAGCDLVIEAVFERRDLKNEVTAAAQAALGDSAGSAVLASNTSTLPITGLARAAGDPARFIGLHFFSPVPKMPLVEIIRGAKTSDATLARAYDFVQQIGKTPIVVNDSRGFYTSRTFATFITEGVRLLLEGVHPAVVENVARRAGFPVGPLAVHDEVSLELSLKVRDQTVADLAEDPAAAGGRPAAAADDPVFAVLDEFVHELGRPGKAGGAGFYDYPADGPKRLWPQLVTRYTKADCGVGEQDVRDRLLFVQALETVRCLEENVLTAIRDANLGSIMGIGFPPATGGTVQFINAYGMKEFAERADYLADQYGERFRPPALLREKAARGEEF
ncbi:MAG TPA: 3-hydroxyacyl-CoA dehydrogenase NAD-binding domain-containing protein [Actinocrinis sp.]|nr:3-hydroxyacyl-CoA dehydrogenase NAD-binding domain-containing protein [Actinocrinis sp.]